MLSVFSPERVCVSFRQNLNFAQDIFDKLRRRCNSVILGKFWAFGKWLVERLGAKSDSKNRALN